MGINAMKEEFEEAELLGMTAFFTPSRINRKTIPVGMHLYEMRGDDNGGADPVQVAERITVNHYGSVITLEALPLPGDGFLDIDPETDWGFTGGGCRTLAGWLAEIGIQLSACPSGADAATTPAIGTRQGGAHEQ